jgi:hypothetical protein
MAAQIGLTGKRQPNAAFTGIQDPYDLQTLRHNCEAEVKSVNSCHKSVNPTLVLFNDKALYRLNEHVNLQNSGYWSAENPMLRHKVPLHDVMFGVWCATGTTRIIWPFYYCRPCSHTNTLLQTLQSHQYITHMLTPLSVHSSHHHKRSYAFSQQLTMQKN